MSTGQKSQEIINLLSQIIDRGKLENLIKNLNDEKGERELPSIPLPPETANPQKLTPVQKKQHRYNLIAKKFREKYRNF